LQGLKRRFIHCCFYWHGFKKYNLLYDTNSYLPGLKYFILFPARTIVAGVKKYGGICGLKNKVNKIVITSSVIVGTFKGW
jgi:hypothetical protein